MSQSPIIQSTLTHVQTTFAYLKILPNIVVVSKRTMSISKINLGNYIMCHVHVETYHVQWQFQNVPCPYLKIILVISKCAMSIFKYRNSGSIKTCHVHVECFRYLKKLHGSVPSHILHIGIHSIHITFCFSSIPFLTGHKMMANFNLNYLSFMFSDMARFDTTTTKYDIIRKS